jgi:hypothetical protein
MKGRPTGKGRSKAMAQSAGTAIFHSIVFVRPSSNYRGESTKGGKSEEEISNTIPTLKKPLKQGFIRRNKHIQRLEIGKELQPL